MWIRRVRVPGEAALEAEAKNAVEALRKHGDERRRVDAPQASGAEDCREREPEPTRIQPATPEIELCLGLRKTAEVLERGTAPANCGRKPSQPF